MTQSEREVYQRERLLIQHEGAEHEWGSGCHPSLSNCDKTSDSHGKFIVNVTSRRELTIIDETFQPWAAPWTLNSSAIEEEHLLLESRVSTVGH